MSDGKKPSERFSFAVSLLTMAKDTVQFWGPALAGAAARLLRAPWYVVAIAAALKVVNVRKLKYARYLDTEPYDSQTAVPKLDENEEFRVVEFVIKHPIPGGKYAIDWEFQP